jgi:hypothetical protein
MQAAILSVGDSVRRVVDGLLRGACWPTGEVALAIADLFRAPGRMTHLARSTCVACAGSAMPCLGVPIP